MLVVDFRLVYFIGTIVCLAVAFAMWLFYRNNQQQAFLCWAMAFVMGGITYALAADGVLMRWGWPLQLPIGLGGTFLLIGGLFFRLPRLSRTVWWLLLFAPIWLLTGVLLNWPLFWRTLGPALLAVGGYIFLATCFWSRYKHHQQLASATFFVATMLAALVMLYRPLLPPGIHPAMFFFTQSLHLVMAIALLVLLLREQQEEASRMQAGKEGALQRILRSRRRLAELNDRTGLLLRQVSDGIVICDEKGAVISFNQAAERIFGYDQAEVAGTPFSRLLTPASWDQAFGYREGHLVPNYEGHRELEGIHRSGMTLPIDISVSSLNFGEHVQQMVILRDVSERKKQESRLNFFATHDALTGLYNRHHFEQVLGDHLGRAAKGWLIFLDLDDFKLINDALGHQAGDTALVAISKRLLSTLGDEALIARHSGDEFVMFVTAGDKWTEERLLTELNQLLHQPVSSSGLEFMLSGSLGVVRVPEHGKTVHELLRNADLAMYQAKRRGKNKYTLYTESLLNEVGRKADMATRLKSLVPDEQLSVFFQPRVGLPDRELCGAEALLRWRTPEGEYVSPEHFIPVAEETGQILRIGYWVMEQACQWLAGWTSYQDPFVVSINLSPRQLFDERLVERIEALRLRHGLAAAQLEFEITESSAMQDPEYAIRVLSRLRALGYGLSLDDFGTGFSSLSQLRRLPVSVLKIDKSFIQNMVKDRHDRVMVAAIIELAVHLDISVLAEGVETRDQLNLLDALGCNEIQGYLVSKPLPAEQFVNEVLTNWNQYSRSLVW
jgi:diguanylate cyclase (GGDEF)-like protein/PAS domain S-box-containing protein